MATLLYNSALEDLARGAIDFDTDTFKALLVTSAYAPNKDTHTKRSDVTNEVSGTGYTAGGKACTFTLTKDLTNDRLDISLDAVSWPASTIANARQIVVYKSRGGAASADELVFCADFGADKSSSGGSFDVTTTTPLRFQN